MSRENEIREAKILKSREGTVEINGKTWTFRRPTNEEIGLIHELGLSEFARNLYIVKNFTVGWELVELDLFPGGGPEKVPFDSGLFAVWVADEKELWPPLATAIYESFFAYTNKRDEALKN